MPMMYDNFTAKVCVACRKYRCGQVPASCSSTHTEYLSGVALCLAANARAASTAISTCSMCTLHWPVMLHLIIPLAVPTSSCHIGFASCCVLA